MNSLKSKVIVMACLLFGVAYIAVAEEPKTRPNVATWTMGGMQLWEDLNVHAGWRVQRNIATGHARLLDDQDIRRAWGTVEACESALSAAKSDYGLAPRSDKAVVLLHGLGRTKGMFDALAAHLEAEGYEVVVINYPSTRRSIKDHVAQVETVLGNLEGISEVSFMTHSLGGIVMRGVLAPERASQSKWRDTMTADRLVMMGPPNQGSDFARDLPAWASEPVMGSIVRELHHITTADWPVPQIEFGIIAGGRGDDGYNPLISGNDDGAVGVSETTLSGASDFIVVEGLHSFLPSNPAAIEAATRFLEHGAF